MSGTSQNAVWVEIVSTRGSVPRDAGTAMEVTAAGIRGTIGGGALEHEATRIAQSLENNMESEILRTIPLGPDLGQCCGGSVTLRFSRRPGSVDASFCANPEKAAKTLGSLWIWGAGHVGRAVMKALPAGAYRTTWIDTAPDRFPLPLPASALPAADMPLLASRTPVGVHHLVFTFSHEIDLAVCAELLRRRPASLGLIGSETKKMRFFKRLRSMGLDPTSITCPIGDKRLGKAPSQIAAGVVAGLMQNKAEVTA